MTTFHVANIPQGAVLTYAKGLEIHYHTPGGNHGRVVVYPNAKTSIHTTWRVGNLEVYSTDNHLEKIGK